MPRQRAILEAALDAVISIDRSARVTYVNSAFEHIFGYRADEVTGRELGEAIIPPSLREAHRQGFAPYLATGQARVLDRRIELTAMRADGSKFPVEIAITRTGVTGDPAFTAYVRDITERQRAEHELMASRARLVAASDAARQRVTRDLHDGAQQRLVTTLINLQLAELKWESAPERARELVALAVRDAKRGIEDLREIVSGIHPAILTQRGLAAAIDALAAGLPISVRLDIPDSRRNWSMTGASSRSATTGSAGRCWRPASRSYSTRRLIPAKPLPAKPLPAKPLPAKPRGPSRSGLRVADLAGLQFRSDLPVEVRCGCEGLRNAWTRVPDRRSRLRFLQRQQ